MKSRKYFEKYNIFGANFDSGICISMRCIYVKECTTPSQVLYLKSKFLCKNGNKWPPLSWDMPYILFEILSEIIQHK